MLFDIIDYKNIRQLHGMGKNKMTIVYRQSVDAELLHGALHYFFHQLYIDETSICVHIDNEKAIKLYRKAGFREANILNNYILRLL